jgi:Type IV pilus assembly protein PilM
VIDRVRRPRLGIVLIADQLLVAVARPGRVVETFSVVNAENPAAALRAEFDARGVRARAARVAIPRSLVTVKPLDLPATVESELEQMVRFEVERHVPFAADDALVDFAPVPAEGDGCRVMLLAAERRVTDRALQLMAEAKIRPASLTVASHDLPMLLSRQPAAQRTIWLHRVADTAEVLVLRGNTPVMSRSVVGSDPSQLTMEIRRTLGLFRWADSDALWVSGDDAARYLQSAEAAEFGPPPGPPPISTWARRALGTTDGAAWLATAVAMGPPSPRLNLLPVPLRPKRLSRGQLTKIGLLVLTVVLGLVSLFAQGMRNSRHLSRLDADIRQLNAEVAAVERLRREVERTRRLLETAQGADAASLRPLPVLRELTELLSSDVWLMTLSLDQKGLEMTGQAAVASSLIPLVENSPRLERAEFVSPVTRGRDKEQFRIKAAWETSPGTGATETLPPAARAAPGAPTPDRRSAPPGVPGTPDPDVGAPSRFGGRSPATPAGDGPPHPNRSTP